MLEGHGVIWVEKRIRLPKPLFAGVALVCTCLLIVMGYLGYSGDHMTSRHAPHVHAAMEIKLNATLGHLWFEEILSGDSHEDIQQVWTYLDQADWYATTMLEGGRNEKGVFLPLTDESMRSTIKSVRLALKNFRSIAQERYTNFQSSRPGSDIDQKFDRIFANFMNAADQVETLTLATISKDLTRFRSVSIILLTLSILLSIFVAYILYRMERQRELHLTTIEQAHNKVQGQHAKLNYLAHFDTLTDLPNRTLFLDRLEQSIIHAKRKNHHVALLFIDLDKFKSVNDTLGHPAGDKLLNQTAERLRKSVRSEDTVARLGGDEFTVILSDIESKEHALDAASSVSGKILSELAEPFGVSSSTTFVTASIGVTIFPQDGESADELLSNADRAMFEAKNQGKNNFQFHSPELNARAKRLLLIENELSEALDKNQLTVYYQPQWNLQEGSLVGIEALVRWPHPQNGLMLPESFIPVAESCGLIDRIDVWVLETACQQYRSWRKEGLKPGKVSVNLSPKQFKRPDFIHTISDIVAKSCIEPGDLELELTESALMEDTHKTRDLLQQLRNLGIKLAIDDFGTGYSSMAYLRNFPVDTLKIDKSFIQVIHNDKTADAILTSMIDLARKLEINVVAEGIETDVQENYLRALDCYYGQGFKLAKPMTADEFRLLMINTESEKNSSKMIP